jgi:nucleoside 2-deoxyribosyltransferase
VKNTPKTVYIAGALTDMPEARRQELRQFYESIAQICSRYGLEPYLPHLNADPARMTNLTPARVDRIDRLAVTSAYLVLAYVGVPSTGVGIEVEMAYHSGKPVALLAEQYKLDARRVSRLVRGNPAVISEIGFEDFADARTKLQSFLQLFTANIEAEDLPEPLGLSIK